MKTMTIAEVRELTSTELRKVAAELGIKNYSRYTKDQLAQKVVESIQSKTKLDLVNEVDEFVDALIEERRDGVYTEVMKVLGGNFDSDIDDLFESATEEQLKEALTFKKIKAKKEESTKSKTKKSDSKETTSIQSKERQSKDAPRKGSKSEEILKFLQENPEMSVYKIAKQFNTYYSVVDRVKKTYLKK